jgi:hypothetical protein
MWLFYFKNLEALFGKKLHPFFIFLPLAQTFSLVAQVL